MKEKHINKIKTKHGFSLSVIIPVNGKAKRFGTFKRSDYDSDRAVMAAARECRDKALMDIRQNRVIKHDLTVDEAYQKSLDLFVTNVKTRERHEITYHQLVPENIQRRALSKVTAADIQTMINKFAETHSADALSRTKTLWKQIYRAAMMSGCPIVDQSLMIVMPKAKKPQSSHKKHCTAEDLEVFINDGLLEYNAHTVEGRKVGQDVHLAIRLMEYLGLRPQEAFAVCAEDIDLEHGLIRIQRSVGSDASNKRQLIATKTGESVRVLPIPAPLEPYIRELLTHDTRPLLMDVDGLPYDTSMISTLLCNVSNAKKVPHINQYMLRHMFGTDMTKQDLKVAQSMMGHENPEQTLQYAKESSIAEMADALKNRRFS